MLDAPGSVDNRHKGYIPKIQSQTDFGKNNKYPPPYIPPGFYKAISTPKYIPKLSVANN